MDVEFAKAFLRKAEEDLRSAEILFKQGIYSNALYLAQQAAEKAAKGLLIIYGRYVPEHIVSEAVMSLITDVPSKLESKIEELGEVLFRLEKYWLKSRYPLEKDGRIWDPTKEYTKSECEKAIRLAKKALKIVEMFLEDVDG